MIIIGLKDVPETGDPFLHQDLVVMVSQLLQQRIHLFRRKSIAQEGVWEQKHQVFDLQKRKHVFNLKLEYKKSRNRLLEETT